MLLVRPITAAFLASLAGLVLAVPGAQIAVGDARAADSWSWDNCGEDADPVHINSITVSPDPPKIGAELTVTIDAQVEQTIEEGATADVLVKVGRIKLLQQTFDICEEARKANASVSCPVEPGAYTIVQSVELPKEVPKLKYVINVQGFTSTDEPMVCVDLTVQFRPFFQIWD
ncbi:ML domain-containing protein [Mycena belliarum]|uniref:Phosphatidylglycerol/phosphatidylinositol transfer protein n=1 Tax=Mycena belliarum TaxID=1033014 RepID=A0AAD6XLE9_9AGAR|nr:ML domain-containing protein [Mycena belliae]